MIMSEEKKAEIEGVKPIKNYVFILKLFDLIYVKC